MEHKMSADVFYCSAAEWGSASIKLKCIKDCAPDLWENIKYKIGRRIGLFNHSANKSKAIVKISGKLVIHSLSCDGNIAHFPMLQDKQMVFDQSVILISRFPCYNERHFVPLGCKKEWEIWMSALEAAWRRRKDSNKNFRMRHIFFVAEN